MFNGLLIAISAPSGAGKSTLIRELRKEAPKIFYSVSATTRPPRQGEKEGREYFFISENKFVTMKKANKFLECAKVHGYWYGTPKDFIEKKLKAGHDILFDVDVQGGKEIKKIFPETVLIFVFPPSLAILESRLRNRRQDNETAIQKRLRAAQSEIDSAKNYDYLILNEQVPQAVNQLKCIITAERSRIERNQLFFKKISLK